MVTKPSEKRVVMAHEVAKRYLEKVAKPEFRFDVLYGAKDIRNLPGLLRSLRDGRIAMAGVGSISDLGVKENFDSLTVWSSQREPLIRLRDWFERRGFETTGVFW